jgi:hypothetical protein
VHISTRNMLSADDVDDYAYFDISNQCIICMLMFGAPNFALNSSHQVKTVEEQNLSVPSSLVVATSLEIRAGVLAAARCSIKLTTLSDEEAV